MEHLPTFQPLYSQPDPHHYITTNSGIPNHHQSLPHYDPYHQLPPPNPNPSDALNPPGVDHYTTHTGYSTGRYPYGYVASTAVPVEGHGYTAKDAVRQYGADPVAYSATVAATYPTGLGGLNPQVNSLRGVGLQGTSFRNTKKKVLKVVQSVRCDVCNINLNSQEVLNNHKLGRKHKRNLEKLRESIMPQQLQPPKSLVPNAKTETGSFTKREKNKSVPRSMIDFETKKRKVLEGGAAQDAVKVCTLCKVVCNSNTVFNFHLAGQKHAAAVKKLAALGS